VKINLKFLNMYHYSNLPDTCKRLPNSAVLSVKISEITKSLAEGRENSEAGRITNLDPAHVGKVSTKFLSELLHLICGDFGMIWCACASMPEAALLCGAGCRNCQSLSRKWRIGNPVLGRRTALPYLKVMEHI